ncbi:MAG: hypothetical protein J6P29_00605 [Acetobacter sp.]|nr:hypothetical protein [Acetobacter sp.]
MSEDTKDKGRQGELQAIELATTILRNTPRGDLLRATITYTPDCGADFILMNIPKGFTQNCLGKIANGEKLDTDLVDSKKTEIARVDVKTTEKK